jgi:hypothetical protein
MRFASSILRGRGQVRCALHAASYGERARAMRFASRILWGGKIGGISLLTFKLMNNIIVLKFL